MAIPTVEEYFQQFAEAGHIFPKNKMQRVRLRSFDTDFISLVNPNYLFARSSLCDEDGADLWCIKGNCKLGKAYDIIAVLDDAGNVIAGEV